MASTLQTIPRLTPLADVLAMLDIDIKAIKPRSIDVSAALNRILAVDAMPPTRPSAAIALTDGWALRADDTLGASAASPVMLMRVPARTETGSPLPTGTDCVAPYDTIVLRDGHAEAFMTVDQGTGVLPLGGDSDASIPMHRSGRRLTRTDVAAITAVGLSRIMVREPRVHVLPLRGSGLIHAAARLIASDAESLGGSARLDDTGLGVALATDTTDLLVCIGGTGVGRADNSVQMLAREARVAVHGIAIAPGETAAIGFAGARPILLLPGRLDSALAVWLTVGRHMLARLSGALARDDGWSETMPLSRAITSAIGIADVVPVRRVGGQAEPQAARYWPLSKLAHADGWVLVGADSEGHTAGTPVTVRRLP